MTPVRETSPQQGFAWTAGEAAPNAAAAAFLALVYSQNHKPLPEQEALDQATQAKLRCWAMGQANFLLGVNKQRQSFIVNYAAGEATQAPRQPQHQASSCPRDEQGPCDWKSGYAQPTPNPQLDLATGALVAGVDLSEAYPENRQSPSARVGTHYQAPWLALLAGLVQTNTNVMSCGQQGVYQKVSREKGRLGNRLVVVEFAKERGLADGET